MHSGGGPANFATRSGAPSAGGHSVASVSVMPAGGAGSSAAVPAAAAVVVVDSPVVVVVAAVSSSSSPPVSATTAPMATRRARTTPTIVSWRRRRSFTWTWRRASSTRGPGVPSGVRACLRWSPRRRSVANPRTPACAGWMWVEGCLSAAGTVPAVALAGPEVRRDVGRRPRAHPRGGRPRGALPPPRRRRRARRVGHGQGDRRAAPPRRRGVRHPARARDGHADHRRRAQGHRPAVHGARTIWASSRESYTGSQAGFITDTNHTNAKILEVRADRIRAAVAAGTVPVVAGAQGVSTEHDVTFLGRGGSDTTAVALAKALERRCVRALHRRLRRVHHRPAGGARAPARCTASPSTRCSR